MSNDDLEYTKLNNIIKSIDDKVTLVDVSSTFNRRNYTRYINNIKTKPNVMLFVQKNTVSQWWFRVFHHDAAGVAIFYIDSNFTYPSVLDESLLKFPMRRILAGENHCCSICLETVDSTLTCLRCGVAICSKCLIHWLPRAEKELDNNILKVVCTTCKMKGLFLQYPVRLEVLDDKNKRKQIVIM